MSAIFQRPLCDMGRAYEFALRPLVGDADTGAGGPCDDHPHRVEICSSAADPASPATMWRAFDLCPEHESQLRQYDRRLADRGMASRFRTGPLPEAPPAPRGGRAR
jgi:hypothetical protein